MVTVLFFLGPGPDRVSGFVPHDRPVEMSRLPTAGELVSFGKDDDGVPADYRVMLVRHLLARGRDGDPGAEVYARRVWAATEVAERAPRHAPDSPWRRGALPRLPPR